MATGRGEDGVTAQGPNLVEDLLILACQIDQTGQRVMKTRSASPASALAPYIERYWGGTAGPQERVILPKLLPGTGSELFFHYRAPFRGMAPDGSIQTLPQRYLLNLRERTLALAPATEVDFIAVRFRAGGLRHFFPVPMAQLVDQIVVPDELADGLASPFARLADATSWEERVQCLNRLLLSLLQRYHQQDKRIDPLVQTTYYAYREDLSATLERLRLDVSRRQLRRWFHAAVGVSPKQFHRLSRFQHSIRQLLLAQNSTYLPTALENGYFDQSHFIHECVRLTNESPGRLLCARNFMSHFYNRSLDAKA